jgi:DNA-binding NarL/FixJ family response regulator
MRKMRQTDTLVGRRTAAIVQAQPLMVPFLTDVLRCTGHSRVVTYRSWAKRLRRAKPDVAILDAEAANATPLALIRRIKSNARTRIVVITGHDDSVWNAVARALGADAILGPGADRQDLFTAVRGA